MKEIGETEKYITVKKASQLMGKSEQFIRVVLQRNRLPFGTDVQLSTQWTYYISPKLFYDFIGRPEEYNK